MAGEKRSQEHENAEREETIVLIDIEGTTTSISFVKDTLFPYVRAHLKDYIEKKWDDAEFKADVEKLKEQFKKDEEEKVEGLVPITTETVNESKESLLKNVLWQMDNDRKTGALKQLQGHIWRDAYQSGAIKGHVYADVPKALEAWTKDGRKVYVYSSGSVEAQKLLFGNSEHGDLLKYFSGYFDTEVGPKQEASSYKSIITKIDCEASKILFLTDIANEAKAAVEAGMSSAIVIREGNASLTADEKTAYPTITSFQDLSFQMSAKRPKLDETESKKEEPKKVEELVKIDVTAAATASSEPAATIEDVEMTDVSENKKPQNDEPEVKAVVETEKETEPTEKVLVTEEAKVEAMETSETTTAESEKSAKDKEKAKEKETEEEKVTKKIEEPVSKASTSESAKPESDAKTSEVTKVEEKIEPTKKVSDVTLKPTETKTEQVEKPDEKIVQASKAEAVVEKTPEPEKTPAVAEAEKKTTEPVKSEEVPKEDKSEETKEKPTSKPEEKQEPEEKVVTAVEEKKQNGDAKPEAAAVETTLITNGAATTVTAEVNGDSKEEKITKEKPQSEIKETEKPEESEKKIEAEVAEPAKATTVEPGKDEKEDEKKTGEGLVEKKLNGSTKESTDKVDTTEDKTHRNGVNDENKQNGDDESSTDKESIKVKKVVDSIVDGAAEPEVVPPVAVVAATS